MKESCSNEPALKIPRTSKKVNDKDNLADMSTMAFLLKLRGEMRKTSLFNTELWTNEHDLDSLGQKFGSSLAGW